MISLPSGPFSLSSVTSISEVSPLSSVNCAIIVPSTSIAKLRAANASLLETFGTPVAIYPSLFGDRCAARELDDLEYDELGRLHRGDTDLDDELAGVRAPQTRIPRPGKARITLMPCGLSRSCSLLVICSSSEIAPRTTSLAGALCTPRVSSLRAQMPAMWPLGGTKFAWPASGSKNLTHGQ